MATLDTLKIATLVCCEGVVAVKGDETNGTRKFGPQIGCEIWENSILGQNLILDRNLESKLQSQLEI